MEKDRSAKTFKGNRFKFLLPSVVCKIFNFGKDEVREVRKDYCHNAMSVDAFFGIVVGFVMVFYVVKDFIAYGDGHWAHLASEPTTTAAEAVFLFGAIFAQVHVLLGKFLKKTRPVLNRIANDAFVLFLLVGMLLYFVDDAAKGELSKSKTISPSILWMAAMCICPIAYFEDEIIISLLIGGSVIGTALGLNQIYGVNEIHQYVLAGLAYIFISFVFHSILFYVAAQKYYVNHQNEKLLISSNYDPLTYCWNRNGLRTFLSTNERTINERTRGVAIFDIDFFKQFNDDHSHLDGDRVLREVTHATKELLDKEDYKLIRWGGDEFVLFLNVADENELLAKMDSVRAKIYELKLSNIEEQISISMGGVVVPSGAKFDFKRAFAEADKQLYLAKESGRNCCYVNGRKA